jgi:hypothetical protein
MMTKNNVLVAGAAQIISHLNSLVEGGKIDFEKDVFILNTLLPELDNNNRDLVAMYVKKVYEDLKQWTVALILSDDADGTTLLSISPKTGIVTGSTLSLPTIPTLEAEVNRTLSAPAVPVSAKQSELSLEEAVIFLKGLVEKKRSTRKSVDLWDEYMSGKWPDCVMHWTAVAKELERQYCSSGTNVLFEYLDSRYIFEFTFS